MFADNDQQVRTMSGRGSNWLLEKVSDAITRVLDYSQIKDCIIAEIVSLRLCIN